MFFADLFGSSMENVPIKILESVTFKDLYKPHYKSSPFPLGVRLSVSAQRMAAG